MPSTDYATNCDDVVNIQLTHDGEDSELGNLVFRYNKNGIHEEGQGWLVLQRPRGPGDTFELCAMANTDIAVSINGNSSGFLAFIKIGEATII